MTYMTKHHNEDYNNLILKPLREAVNKGGGYALIEERAGLSRGYLKTLLYRRDNMSIKTLMKLCAALKITLVFMDFETSVEFGTWYMGAHVRIEELPKKDTWPPSMRRRKQ